MYKNGDAVWLLLPRPVGVPSIKSWWKPAVVEKRMGLNTYNISTYKGQIKAAHSSQLNHLLADLIGALVDLSYTYEKLLVEDDAQKDDYLVNQRVRHRPKPGSRDSEDIEFQVPWRKRLHHPKYDQWQPAERFLTVYNKSWRNYCRSHGLLPKLLAS